MNWTGSFVTGAAGTTATAYRTAVIDRVNYFREHAGLLTVTENSIYSSKAQQAALMMSANNQLNHTPPATWTFYTAAGAEAAGKANLFLGVSGTMAVDGYIQDPGVSNPASVTATGFYGRRPSRWAQAMCPMFFPFALRMHYGL